MALTDFADYKTKLEGGRLFSFLKATGNVGQQKHVVSYWLQASDAGSAPSTAEAPDNTTVGALFNQPRLTPCTNPLYIAQADFTVGVSAYSAAGSFLIIDRLSHQGGLSGTTTGAQTTNLPTAALTRSTSGVGVMAALEIYTDIGTSAQTVTASYTNTNDTAGQVTKDVVMTGGTNDQAAARFIFLPLADGDVGVKSVESVTLSGSTGTAGNFGVVLFKPVYFLPYSDAYASLIQQPHANAMLGGAFQLPSVDPAACLQLLNLNNATGSNGCPSIMGVMKLIEVP